MLHVNDIEKFVKENITDCMITHDFLHFKLVSVGAVWFVRVLGGDKYEQDLAYIAGLLHDSVRPETEKIDHAEASAEKARNVLEEFNLDSEDIDKICQAIMSHRKPVEWISSLHQSVFLADKIFEQMGYYVAFRRSAYVSECKDYVDLPFKEAVVKHFAYRVGKFGIDDFPSKFKNLTEEMMKPLFKFTELLSKNEEWAVSLASFCYEKAKTKDMTMEEIIRNFQPDNEMSELYKKETIDYIEGRKFEEFEKMI